MPTINIPEPQSFVLDGEPWSFYSRLLRQQVDENAVVRPFRAWVRQLPPPPP